MVVAGDKTMNREPHVIRLLMHGYDPVLLETRCSILKLAEFDICTVAEPRTLKSFLESEAQPYDLLVVCHSVSVEERKSIAALAASYQTPLCQIEAFIQREELLAEVTRAVSGFKSRRALL